MAARASPTQHLVTRALIATVIQYRYGIGGAMVLVAALVVASVVGGEGGELMDGLGGKF